MSIYAVPPDQVPVVWNEVAPYLKQALEYSHGWWSVPAVYLRLLRKDAQLFVGTGEDPRKIVGIMVTEVTVNDDEDRTSLNVFALAADDLAPFLEEGHNILESWAQEIGANQLTMTGRPGWQGPLKGHGWSVTGVQMRKEMNHA